MNPLFRKPVRKIAVSPSPFFKTDGYLYHGTTPRDLESILEGGAVEGPSFWGVKDIADMYDAGAMLRLPVNRFNQSLLIPDMNMMQDPYFLDDSEGEYDPKKLNALNRAWKASKKTWKDSLKIWGAVIYDENLPVAQADVLGEQPIVSSKIADDANIGTVKNIIAEMMGVLSGGLPQPEVKIVNQTNRMLGQNVWQWGRRSDGQTFGADNTTMEIQKRVLTDETTLRRIIAHELCHHEVSLLVAKPKLLELGFETYKRFGNILGPDGHGKEWKAVASRFNAKYGADFVTRTSDQDFVYGTTDDKELFILLNNYVYGRHKQRLGWQWAVTLSPKAKELLNSLDWESGEYKLVKSTDHNLTRGRAKIRQWGGWNLSRTPEQEAAIQKLWAEAPATKVAAEEDDQADYNKVREDRVKTYAKFIDLADEQRGAPESAMLKIQHDPLGAGVYSFAVEHTGDLTHRMNERTSIIWGNFGYDSVKNKTEKVLRYLEQGYGFEREMQGNLKNNYGAMKDEKLKGISYEDAVAKFKAKGLAYANAHAALTVYNRPQELCRDAAVALGKWEFDKTRAIMNTIMSLLNEGPEAWVAQASQGANIDKTAKTGPHKASTAMVVLPSSAAAKMMEAAMQIPDEELGADGREDEPHITIKYGVKDDVELLKNTVAGVKPFNVTLGKTHVFEVSESSNGQAPIVVEVHGPELAELHDTVNRIMGTRPDDFEYKPHVTLAYVRADIAMKYKGLDWCEGISFQVNSVTLSRKGGSKTPVEFGKQASHKTPPMSDTHYRDPELGEETNAYANLPLKVDGLTEFPTLESLSPDLFKTGAQNFKPMLFDNWADANPMYQPDDFNEAEWRYDENVAHFSTLDFPVTVYRAIEIEAGTQVDLDNAGTYWSWVENSAQAYFGEGSIWGPGGKKIKEPLIVMLKAQILRSTDVDWDATLLANMLNEEENEINVKSGAQLRLLG